MGAGGGGSAGYGSLLGAIGTAGLSAAFDFGSSALQFSQAKKLQKRSYKLARQFRATAVDDLRAQGLNPILAAGATSAGGAFGQGTPAPMGDGGSLITSAKMGAMLNQELKNMKMQNRQMWNDAKLKHATRELVDQQAITEIARGRREWFEGDGQAIINSINRAESVAAYVREKFDRENPGLVKMRRILESLGLSANRLIPRRYR